MAGSLLDVLVVDGPEQLRRWVTLANAVDPEGAYPFDYLVEQDACRRQPQERLLAVDVDGTAVIAARVGASPSGAAATLRIVRDRARTSIEDANRVANRLEAWARDLGVTKLRAVTYDQLADELEMWRQRGWQETSRKPAVALQVCDAPDRPAPPIAGIEFTTLAERPGLEREVYDTYLESWSTTPWATADGTPTFERWWGNIGRWPGSSPDQFLLAMDGDRVVGYCELDFGASGDRTSVWNGYTGVRPSHRRRGIAMALKLRCIEWARAHGVERITTSNDADNEAMRGINAALGYEPAFAYVTIEREA